MSNSDGHTGTALAVSTTASASWRVFMAAYLGWIFDYYEVYFLTIVIVPMSKSLGWSPAQISVILSAQLASFAVGGVLWGVLCDRFGRKWALQLCILQYSIGALARAFTPNFAYMMFFTIFGAIGIGGEYGVGQTLVTETVGKERRGAWSSMLYSGIFIGIVLAAAAGGLLLPRVGWSKSLLISALPALLVVFIRSTTPESALWEHRKRTGDHIVPMSQYAKASFLRPLALCYVTGTLQYVAYYGITTLMPTYLIRVAGFSLSRTSWWIFFTGIAGLAGATLAAVFVDRLGRRATLSIAGIVGAVGGVLVFAFWSHLRSLTGILLPFSLLYAGFGASASVFGSLFSEVFPTALRATGISSALQLGRGTTFIAPLIAGALYPVVGYPPLIIAAVVLMALMAAIAWRFPETAGMEVNY